MTYLGDVAAGVTGDDNTLKTVLAVLGWVTSFAVAVIGALHLKNAKLNARAEGKAEAQMIGPQPFIVQLREEFATRRELEKLEASMIGHVAEMKNTASSTTLRMENLFERTMEAMEKQSTSLGKRLEGVSERTNKKIEEVASGAYQGRQRIHNIQNNHGERISRMEATSDVAESLGKLAEAIQPVRKPDSKS